MSNFNPSATLITLCQCKLTHLRLLGITIWTSLEAIIPPTRTSSKIITVMQRRLWRMATTRETGVLKKAAPSDMRLRPLESGGWTDVGNELEPRCQVVPLTETRKHTQGTSLGRKRMTWYTGRTWDARGTCGCTCPVALGYVSRWSIGTSGLEKKKRETGTELLGEAEEMSTPSCLESHGKNRKGFFFFKQISSFCTPHPQVEKA